MKFTFTCEVCGKSETMDRTTGRWTGEYDDSADKKSKRYHVDCLDKRTWLYRINTGRSK